MLPLSREAVLISKRSDMNFFSGFKAAFERFVVLPGAGAQDRFSNSKYSIYARIWVAEPGFDGACVSLLDLRSLIREAKPMRRIRANRQSIAIILTRRLHRENKTEKKREATEILSGRGAGSPSAPEPPENEKTMIRRLIKTARRDREKLPEPMPDSHA